MNILNIIFNLNFKTPTFTSTVYVSRALLFTVCYVVVTFALVTKITMFNYKLPIISVCVLVIFSIRVIAQFDWQIRDGFDDITSRMGKVGADNCKVVDRNALFLPQDAVTHVPDIRKIGIDPVLPNRTNLLQIHNMALSRAFFYRYEDFIFM